MPPRKRKGKPAGQGALDPNALPAEQASTGDDHRRGLLSLRVPLAVTLVAKRQSVARLSTLTPGTILRFDKPCTSELELQAAGKTIARGYCVCQSQSQRLGILLVDRAEPDACA